MQALLDSLETLADEADGKRAKWRDVWSEIKNIGQAFKESRFPTAPDRQAAWSRFQSIVAKVKAGQERARHKVEVMVHESERHLEQIRSYAWKATPSSESSDALLAIVTGGLSVLVKAGIEAILGPFDERRLELQRCSEVLKEGWAYLSRNKGEMLGKHKKEAFDALSNASDALRRAWDTWRTGRQHAIEQYRSQKQTVWEAHQAEREEKHRQFVTRVVANTSNLEEKLAKATGALERQEDHLADLREKYASAWNDSFKDRCSAWIDECETRTQSIKEHIERLEGWIGEERAKLG